MTIYASDIKFFQRAENSDFDTGIGPVTGDVIPDGQIGALFAPITELASLEGRVMLRGAAAAIDTPTRELFGGAHLMLTEIPADPALVAVMASAGNEFARRAQVVKAFGSYYLPAGRFLGYVFEVQRRNSKFLQVWMEPGSSLPAVDTTLALIQDGGTNAEVEQYVKVKEVSKEEIWSEDDRGRYMKWFLTLTLDRRLSVDFNGAPISRFAPVPATVRTKIYTVSVSDSAHYYGVAKLAEAATVGQRTIHVDPDTLFAQIVPASVSPSPQLNLNTGGVADGLVPAASIASSRQVTGQFGNGTTLYVQPWVPNTLNMDVDGAILTDVNGDLMLAGVSVGVTNPGAGTIRGGSGCPDLNSPKLLTYLPAGVVSAPCMTAYIAVTASNQDTAYTTVLPIIPLPGSLQVEYVYKGDIYTLHDRGDYYLVGDSEAFGNATFVAGNKSLAISLRVAPDIGWIIIKCAVPGYTFARGGLAGLKARFKIVTEHPLPPGAVTVTWVDLSGDSKSAHDDGLGSLVSEGGHATGKVIYAENTILIYPTVLPQKGCEFTVSITPRPKAVETFDPLPLGLSGAANITLAQPNVVPGSIRVAFTRVVDESSGDIYTGVDSQEATSAYLQAPPQPHPVSSSFLFHDTADGHMAGLLNSNISYAAGTLEFDVVWSQQVVSPKYSIHQVT